MTNKMKNWPNCLSPTSPLANGRSRGIKKKGALNPREEYSPTARRPTPEDFRSPSLFFVFFPSKPPYLFLFHFDHYRVYWQNPLKNTTIYDEQGHFREPP